MEINDDISKYAFRGVRWGLDRTVIATLKNVFVDLSIINDYSFDTEDNHYSIFKSQNQFFTRMTPNRLKDFMIISPYEYLCVLLNQKVDLKWFNQLQEGDIVRIGWCSLRLNDYCFGFDTRKVKSFFSKEVTIEKIKNGPARDFPGYFNGDLRAYYIKEMDQYVPSSVFIPQLVPTTPIQKINLISCFIDIDNGLK